MTKARSNKTTCDYQVADWNENYRTCDAPAIKASLPKGKPAFNYCKKHWEKAEPYLAPAGIPVSDIE